MRVEEVVSSFIMFIVSGLVLVGFTIAWYTNTHIPAVTGMEVVAAEIGDVKVALASGGKDISELTDGAQYADIGVEEFTNVDAGELAPGTYGKVTFYITPTNSNVRYCEIVPTVRITQDGSTWYPDISVGDAGNSDATDGGGDVSDGDVSTGDASASNVLTIEKLYKIAQEHLRFFADEEMTQVIKEGIPFEITWTSEDWEADNPGKAEKKVELYWKWHYEYPFTEAELTGEDALTDAEQMEKIRDYDKEDMLLGNNLSGIKFYFTFSAK